MSKYDSGGAIDEPEITAVLVDRLDVAFEGQQIAGLTWQSTIVRHGKGTAAEDKEQARICSLTFS
jgi:hypothetical protein